MEPRLKERLTGALILVALLVIVVPEMLSGPDDRPRREAAATAEPATEAAPLRSYTMDLTAAAPPPPAQPAEPSPRLPVAPEAPPPAPAADATAGAATAPAGDDATAEQKAEMPRPEVRPAAKPGATRPAAPTAAGGWLVQVGGFAQQDNARRLVEELRRKGFTAQVSRATGPKGLYRVRVGPVVDRAAAVELQSRLAGQGHRGTLVAP